MNGISPTLAAVRPRSESPPLNGKSHGDPSSPANSMLGGDRVTLSYFESRTDLLLNKDRADPKVGMDLPKGAMRKTYRPAHGEKFDIVARATPGTLVPLRADESVIKRGAPGTSLKDDVVTARATGGLRGGMDHNVPLDADGPLYWRDPDRAIHSCYYSDDRESTHGTPWHYYDAWHEIPPVEVNELSRTPIDPGPQPSAAPLESAPDVGVQGGPPIMNLPYPVHSPDVQNERESALEPGDFSNVDGRKGSQPDKHVMNDITQQFLRAMEGRDVSQIKNVVDELGIRGRERKYLSQKIFGINSADNRAHNVRHKMKQAALQWLATNQPDTFNIIPRGVKFYGADAKILWLRDNASKEVKEALIKEFGSSVFPKIKMTRRRGNDITATVGAKGSQAGSSQSKKSQNTIDASLPYMHPEPTNTHMHPANTDPSQTEPGTYRPGPEAFTGYLPSIYPTYPTAAHDFPGAEMAPPDPSYLTGPQQLPHPAFPQSWDAQTGDPTHRIHYPNVTQDISQRSMHPAMQQSTSGWGGETKPTPTPRPDVLHEGYQAMPQYTYEQFDWQPEDPNAGTGGFQ